jgi:hypothetical protein
LATPAELNGFSYLHFLSVFLSEEARPLETGGCSQNANATLYEGYLMFTHRNPKGSISIHRVFVFSQESHANKSGYSVLDELRGDLNGSNEYASF